ncbi:MAG: hypothetical protein WC999_16050 [Hydrogenophaga sp.]
MSLRDVLVVIPAYGLPERETAELLRQLEQSGCSVLTRAGIGLIDRVRSELASRALETQHQRWLWLDADMAASIGEVARLVETAERHDLDLLSAVYVTKERPANPAVVWDAESPSWPTPRRDAALCGIDGGLYPIRRVGFGMAVTHRRLFERIAPTLPEVTIEGCGAGARPYFLPLIVGRHYLGEDYSLCERARETGSTLWADTRIRVGHVGRYVYRWEDIAPPAASRNLEMVWQTES